MAVFLACVAGGAATTRYRVIITFPIVVFLSLAALAPAFADSLNIVWESGATSRADLSKNFADLYGSLDRLYKLGIRFPTKQVPWLDRSLRKVLVDEGQYSGSIIPIEVSHLTCRLNEDICSISQDTNEPKWTGDHTEKLTIPNINFTEVRTHEYYNARRGDTIEGIFRDRQGCKEIDSDCLDLLRSLNPDENDVVESPNGRIVVPTLNYFADIPLEPTGLSVSGRGGLEASTRRAQDIVTALNPIMKNLVTIGPIEPQSVPTKSIVFNERARRKELFDSVHNDWDPTVGGPYLRVNIAMIDGRVDEKHCDFDVNQIHRNIARKNAEPADADDQNRDECDTVLVSSPSLADHGTHVAGIIAARTESKIGPGMYPFSDIYSYEIDLDNAGTFVASVGALLEQVYRDHPKVVNMSDSYSRTLNMTSDPFETQIINGHGPFRKQALIIAAAGNSGTSFSGDPDCPVKPACYGRKYRNVMSVIALDDDPAKPSPASFAGGTGSNFGEQFDVGAPGTKVPSTVSMNRIAEMDGTSQATPMVSGAAAHLYAIRPTALPGEIKNRLTYTCDVLASLSGKVLGGRLNVHRAISDIDYDVLTLDQEAKSIRGNIHDKEKYEIIAREIGREGFLQIPFGSIRRMIKNADGLSWTIFSLSKEAENDSPLERKRVVASALTYKREHTYLTTDDLFIEHDETLSGIKFLTAVSDYVSRMPE